MDKIAAVIVSYKPASELLLCVKSIRKQVQSIIIVENGSGPEFSEWIRKACMLAENVQLIRNVSNRGIGVALNQGFRLASEMGCSLALAMDQDSHAEAGMVHLLMKHYLDRKGSQRPAIVAPQIIDSRGKASARYLRPKASFLFERKRCSNRHIRNVSIVISSGAIFDLSVYDRLGGFREDFFIDYVDTEYCLRARSKGYEIIVDCNARLIHRWGNLRTIKVGPFEIRPTFHSPQRWYYISRNRIPTIREYAAVFPHWLIFDLTMAIWWIIRMLLFEDKRSKKLYSLMRGTLDGIRGRMGPQEG